MPPHLDSFHQPPRLTNSRQHDDSFGWLIEQEVLIVCQEEKLSLEETLPDSLIGCTAPAKGDDVVHLFAVSLQAMVQREREVLVEEDLQDAWRTAGGKWAATWAAYAKAARTCSSESWYSLATVSTVSPAAMRPSTVATSIRVPAMQGLPKRTSGFMEIPGKTSIWSSTSPDSSTRAHVMVLEDVSLTRHVAVAL